MQWYSKTMQPGTDDEVGPPLILSGLHLRVLSDHLKYEMKSPHLVDFSRDLVDF